MGAFDDEAKHNGTAAVAIVEAFYPGPRGGEALAQGLFGLHNRWGRMPYTIYPKSFEEEASMLQHDLREKPGRTYRYYPNPTFPFGHGLSLTTWSLTGQAPSCLVELATDSPHKVCHVSLTLTNTGPLAGDSVLMAYVRDIDSQSTTQLGLSGNELMPELRRLFDFKRQRDVTAGSSATITFDITPESLMVADEATGDLVLKPGARTLIFEDGGG